MMWNYLWTVNGEKWFLWIAVGIMWNVLWIFANEEIEAQRCYIYSQHPGLFLHKHFYTYYWIMYVHDFYATLQITGSKKAETILDFYALSQNLTEYLPYSNWQMCWINQWLQFHWRHLSFYSSFKSKRQKCFRMCNVYD